MDTSSSALVGSFQVPKVRDGEPLGTVTLIAASSGILVACFLLVIITSMVYKKPPKTATDKAAKANGRKGCFSNIAFEDETSPAHLSIISHTKKPFDDPPASTPYSVAMV